MPKRRNDYSCSGPLRRTKPGGSSRCLKTATVNQSWKAFPRYHHSGPRGAQYGNASLLFTVERRERANLRKFLHSALWGATVTAVSAGEVQAWVDHAGLRIKTDALSCVRCLAERHSHRWTCSVCLSTGDNAGAMGEALYARTSAVVLYAFVPLRHCTMQWRTWYPPPAAKGLADRSRVRSTLRE